MAELVEHAPAREIPARPAASPAAGVPAVRRGRTGAMARLRAWPAVRKFVLALSVLYLAKQAILVLLFPPFTGHDEVAHYSYLRTVATDGRVPVLLEDRLPPEMYRYCKYTLGWWCFPEEEEYLANPPYELTYDDGVVRQEGYQYAANHPPLYYLLMTPIYWLSDGASPETQQYLLRFAAIPFGLATVWLAYGLARIVFPRDAFLAVTVPAFVALQPQISYEAAMVNNDIVCIALYSAMLCLIATGIRDRFPARTCVLLGVTLGLATLAKGTSLTAVPIIGLAVLLAVGWRDLPGILRRGVMIAGPAAVLVAPWYAFLYDTYGNFSGLPQVEEMQWWDEPNSTFFGMLFGRDFAAMRFEETWGYFGWRKIDFDAPILWAIGIPLIFAVGGLVQYAVTANRGVARLTGDPVLLPTGWQTRILVILAVTCVVAYLAVVQFGLDFSLTQARYYFPVINAAALLLMLGLRTLIPGRLHAYGRGAVVLAMLALNVVIATQYVIPYWHRL